MSLQTSGAVRSVYRQLIKLARHLEPDKRVEAFQEIRRDFKSNIQETQEDRISELITKAHSKLGFLRMITPKSAIDQSGVQRLVMIDGKLVEGAERSASGTVISNWDGANMDPDMVSRHYSGLKRAGFRDNNHAKGYF